MMKSHRTALRRAAMLLLVTSSLVAISVNCRSQPTPVAPQTSSTPIQSPVPTSAPPGKTESLEPVASPTSPSPAIAPFPDASLCPDSGEAHDNSLFHALWDGVRGCHYDHEHGQSPFASDVGTKFPDFDLSALLGGVGVGHTNPSSEMENTHKHGGFKWDVTLSHSAGCAGREGVPTGVDAFVIQYHAFGNYAIEFESRIHSAVALMRQCQAENPGDFGYLFVNQHQDYGQRVAPYQGAALSYPDTPAPAYVAAREPYFSVDCFGGMEPCDKYPTRDFVLDHNASADSTWISEPENLSGSGSPLFGLLFRVRDTYQLLDGRDQTHPFTFAWLCSADGGASYAALEGCAYNNSTTRVHELIGEIPAEWDNLAGFDTDPRAGRVTAQGFVSRFGELRLDCAAPGPDCHPVKLVQAFTGRYGASFTLVTGAATFGSENLPERDVYFCDGQLCAEGDPGAEPSGWIGPNN